MSTSIKAFIAIVCAVVIGVAIYGAYQFPQAQILAGASSPVGSTFNTEKQASVAINLATSGANSTSTSITNTDSFDRYVSSFKLGCQSLGTSYSYGTQTGLASLQLSVGTTSASSPAQFSSRSAVALNFAIATNSPDVLIASSTLATATSSLASVWRSGDIMTFYFNATNTAACTVGVNYFGS